MLLQKQFHPHCVQRPAGIMAVFKLNMSLSMGLLLLTEFDANNTCA